MSGVQFVITDTRSVTCPSPASVEETKTFTNYIRECAQQGYRLTASQVLTSGHQRDPYTAGVKLTFQKP